jgi:hypothetical protein
MKLIIFILSLLTTLVTGSPIAQADPDPALSTTPPIFPTNTTALDAPDLLNGTEFLNGTEIGKGTNIGPGSNDIPGGLCDLYFSDCMTVSDYH